MFKNILLDLGGRFGSQAVYFITSIILTRRLLPQEYGILGMAVVVINFAHIFLDIGFNRAIVQSKEISEIQLSTIFYTNLLAALILTIICFFIATPLAHFYNQSLIKPLFRVLSISFLLNGLSLVPSALLFKNFKFKSNSIISIVSAAIGGVVGIVMAYSGFGVWSLAAQSLTNTFITLVLMFIAAGWFPLSTFSLKSIQPLWRYGSRLFASGVLDALYSRLDTFIIGKLFSPSTLGFYSRAQSMDGLVRQFSAGSIMSALFPYIAKHQHDREYLREVFKKYLHIILFVSVGINGMLYVIATDLFTILFTSRWLFSAELFKIMAIMGFGWPISALMCNIISGVGNSKAFLRLEIYKRLLLLPIYVFGFLTGIKGFVICLMSVSVFGILLNAYFTSREIAFSTMAQVRIILTYLGISVVSCLLTWAIYYPVDHWVHLNHFASLALLASLFGSFYLAFAFIFRLSGTLVIEKVWLIIKGKRGN